MPEAIHVISTTIEHCAVLNPLKNLEEQNKITLDLISPLPRKFHVEVEELKSKIKKETKLISVMMANNETGAIQPVQEIGKLIQMINDKRSDR